MFVFMCICLSSISSSNHNITAPVSCGQPGGKQCSYNTQCNANAAGYNEQQCCPSVPDGVACTANFAPVECGDIPCVYSNQVSKTNFLYLLILT